MVKVASPQEICWSSKPGKEKGGIRKKKHLAHTLLLPRLVLFFSLYELGLQIQHGKCARAKTLDRLYLFGKAAHERGMYAPSLLAFFSHLSCRRYEVTITAQFSSMDRGYIVTKSRLYK
jgi:hypothetical protein